MSPNRKNKRVYCLDKFNGRKYWHYFTQFSFAVFMTIAIAPFYTTFAMVAVEEISNQNYHLLFNDKFWVSALLSVLLFAGNMCLFYLRTYPIFRGCIASGVGVELRRDHLYFPPYKKTYYIKDIEKISLLRGMTAVKGSYLIEITHKKRRFFIFRRQFCIDQNVIGWGDSLEFAKMVKEYYQADFGIFMDSEGKRIWNPDQVG